MSCYSLLNPRSSYPLPRSFRFLDYIETEQELWALFPETCGLRANFCQLGLTAQLYVEAENGSAELGDGETYFLMPCADGKMHPIRMKAVRRLTLSEFRMSQMTALRLAELLAPAHKIMEEVHFQILGPEIVEAM